MPDRVVGNYRIGAKLAEGGMGAVFRATHQLLGRPAAVKVLLPQLSSRRDLVNRFFTEARAASSIRHPGIIEIYDFGYAPSGAAYIVMELLEGESLSRRLERSPPLDEATALVYARGIASALAAAHAKGIVHRDLKPDNVYLVPDPDMPTGTRPKLLDFGVAKIIEAARGDDAAKTGTGVILGTPRYMSPEQCRGAGDVDHRADLYSLGCILYEMLTGQPPFTAEGVGEIIGRHLFFEPTPPTQLAPAVSVRVEALVLALLAKAPEGRIQSAAELVRMLGPASIPDVILAPVTAPPPPSSPDLATALALEPTAAATTFDDVASQAGPAPPTRRRLGWVALGAAVMVAGIAVIIWQSGGASPSNSPSPKSAKPAVTPVPPTAPSPARPPPPVPPVPPPRDVVATPEAPVDAGSAAEPSEKPPRRPVRRRPIDRPRTRSEDHAPSAPPNSAGSVDRGD